MLGVVSACSTVHVTSPSGATIIGRTMELGGDPEAQTGQFRGLEFSGSRDEALPWTVSVHRRGEALGKTMSLVCGHDASWTTKVGYVSVDVVGHPPKMPKINLTGVATDGINEKGLAVSELTLRQSVYMKPGTYQGTSTNVCFAALTTWILGNVESVQALRELLPQLHVLGPVLSVPSGDLVHWAIDDPKEHVVLEVLDGALHLHNNTVGALTNDPDFRWHLRNLNNYANLSPDWPHGGEGIQVQTEIGTLPGAIGHGFNLLGMPGDYSPPSRFVRLFFLRQYAMLRAPPASLNESIALTTGLLNNVFINKGTVASPVSTSVATGSGLEFTQYSVMKIPQMRHFYFKDYMNTRWRLVQLDELDFSPQHTTLPATNVPLADGTVGVEDVTAQLKNANQ